MTEFLTLSEEEKLILKRREAKKQMAIRDLEDAVKRLEEFGYRIEIRAYEV